MDGKKKHQSKRLLGVHAVTLSLFLSVIFLFSLVSLPILLAQTIYLLVKPMPEL